MSKNTRNGAWGTDAIKTISARLKSELVGVRGFSETNIKNMRLFYEEWSAYVNRQPIADDFEVNEEGFLLAIRQPMAGDINWNEFISLGFTHHMEILSKTKNIEERIFYIHECATRAWDKYTLREYRVAPISEVEHTLDRMLDFCGCDMFLALFKKICIYYYQIYPEMITYEINSYREFWDNE